MNFKNKNIEDIYPLSGMQQGMLFHSLYQPASGVYVTQLSCDLHGFNVSAFAQAWQVVVNRHSVLRTAFVWEKLEKPLQVVGRQVKLPWEELDWRSICVDEQQQRLENLLDADRKQGFELSKAPLMRLTLIHLNETTNRFIWSHHHLLLDGWSVSIIFKEVLSYYQGFCQGQNIDLELPCPYRNYIAWLQQQDMSQAEAFWRERLKGFQAPTPLGVDQISLKISDREDNCDRQKIALSVAATTALQSLAQQQHLTLSTLIQGAWALLLSRYSGQDDIVFGATVSGRPSTLLNVESIVGLFINTLPMRVQVTGEEFLLPWLKKIQTQLVEARQYEYSPLLEVQGWSEVPRGVPLFESIVVFENYPVDSSLHEQAADLEISNVSNIEQTNYPLTVLAMPGSELVLEIVYNCHRFDTATIARILGHLKTLLEGIVANPNHRLLDLPLLTEAEQHQLLVEWNDTQADYPQQACIHQLFEAQVEKTPDAVAVVFEDQQLTYRELNARANSIAHHLQKLGVKPEVLVGICVERSLLLIVELLGILKAGGAYVPLDPTYPQERLALIIQNSQIQVLITQQHQLSKLPRLDIPVICLDNDAVAIAQENSVNPTGGATPDNLAYVIYTSGTTGIPKGVAISHRSPVTLIHWAREVYSVGQLAGVLASTSICFDLSVFEIFVPLSWGGSVILADNALQLPELPAAAQVTLLNTVPSAARELLRLNGIPPSVRTVNLAGEALQQSLVQQLYQQPTIDQVFNLYGPSEDTTYSTYIQLKSATPTTSSPAIGRPIANTQIYLLDIAGQPVPIGVAGELHIGGDGLARGYLNRPELTAERFIPNPFVKEKGKGKKEKEIEDSSGLPFTFCLFPSCERLYKTGDLARYLPNGEIEYIGRIDRQVKVRGFRIELGEIEALLSQHPAVRETVVLAQENVPGDMHLVAYVVWERELAPSVSELRHYLKEKLPEYMVPPAFVILEAMPLTPNGKIDRKALPASDIFRNEVSFVPPRNPTEEALAAIYADVLGLEKVSIHDNFFELGGHSLLATRVISRLRQLFEMDLPLSNLFEKPTVALLSDRIATMRLALAQVSHPPITEGIGRKEIEL